MPAWPKCCHSGKVGVSVCGGVSPYLVFSLNTAPFPLTYFGACFSFLSSSQCQWFTFPRPYSPTRPVIHQTWEGQESRQTGWTRELFRNSNKELSAVRGPGRLVLKLSWTPECVSFWHCKHFQFLKMCLNAGCPHSASFKEPRIFLPTLSLSLTDFPLRILGLNVFNFSFIISHASSRWFQRAACRPHGSHSFSLTSPAFSFASFFSVSPSFAGSWPPAFSSMQKEELSF